MANHRQARKISKQISDQRELRELSEVDRATLRNWIERLVLGLELNLSPRPAVVDINNIDNETPDSKGDWIANGLWE